MTTEEKALKYLEGDLLLHMSMIEPIRQKHASILYADSDGVLIQDQGSGAYMLSVIDESAGRKLVSLIGNADLFTVHQKFLVPIVQDKFHLDIVKDCVQAVYLDDKLLPVDEKIQIRVLGPEYVSIVAQNYHCVDDMGYIQDLIDNNEIYGAFIDGSLAGFIGTHKEGTMGLLVVFPQYRLMGVGTALESYMVNLFLSRKQVPFGQVLDGNIKSLALQKKLGFKISEKHLFWIDRD
ncbi:MAG: GNAT family N-acetyltransferase [Clostridia bacterium]|jgi:GNAT superfamily N-acetyltransferase